MKVGIDLDKKHLVKLGIVALIVFLLDQAVKMWVLNNFTVGEARPFIPGVLQLRYFQNTGMAFGILAEYQWVFIVFVPIALILFGVFAIKGKWFPHWLQQVTLVAVIISGFSNWVDRIAHGFVIDMFEPTFIRFAIFNVADSFITVGSIILFITFILSELRMASRKTSVCKKYIE